MLCLCALVMGHGYSNFAGPGRGEGGLELYCHGYSIFGSGGGGIAPLTMALHYNQDSWSEGEE